MSLTSMLKSRGLPLREFFEDRLPNLKPLQEDWRNCGAPSIVPPAPVVWSLVGAAFDYRLRYLFVKTSVEEFVAALGAARTGEVFFSFEIFGASLGEFIEAHNPIGRLLYPAAEAQLARYCYVLAMYESLFRAAEVRSPLLELREGASAEEQLALVPVEAVEDLVALTAAAVDSLGPMLGQRIFANPTFAGSPDVGGADADLIVDSCLIDIKTTKSHGLDRAMVYQLVGYLLLDYEDEYAIRDIGFYLSRVPALIRWPAEAAIASMSNGRETIDGLRHEMRHLLTPKSGLGRPRQF